MKTQNVKQQSNSNRMVQLISTFVIVAIFGCLTISCDSGNDDGAAAAPGVGAADITLTAGGTPFKVAGPCGWASAAGQNYIGATHEANSLRTFSAFFNITTLPTVTTTYTLVEDQTDTNPTHITMSISQISGTTLTEWYSKNASGNLTLVVNGNTITADLSGITLYAQTNHGFYTNGNTGAFANNGALSGTLTFYRN